MSLTMTSDASISIRLRSPFQKKDYRKTNKVRKNSHAIKQSVWEVKSMFVSEVPQSKRRVLQVFTTWKLQLRWSDTGFLRYKIREYLKMMSYLPSSTLKVCTPGNTPLIEGLTHGPQCIISLHCKPPPLREASPLRCHIHQSGAT